LKRLVLHVRYSGAGLALVRLRAGGAVVAESVEPLYAPGTSTVTVPVTRALPRHVSVTVAARSLLADRTVRRVRATLAR
jgi:hypothetical protein